MYEMEWSSDYEELFVSFHYPHFTWTSNKRFVFIVLFLAFLPNAHSYTVRMAVLLARIDAEE